MLNAKNKSDSFILELPLTVNPAQEKQLLVRLDCARQLYNACLSEALRRLSLMRQSKAWCEALLMKKGKPKTEAFTLLNKSFGFREYDLHAFAVSTKNACHIGDHLDVHVCQKISTRTFKTVQEYAFGKRGKPRFKGWNQLISVEGKTNASGIRFRDNEIVWSGLKLPIMFDMKDKHGVQAHALECRIKYVRIICRKLSGKNRFYTQLVQEGKPKVKHPIANGVVGLDLGPSTIAAVSGTDAFLQPFCAELSSIQKSIRTLQRRLDRSRRTCNPDAFRENSTIKPGVRLVKSKAYLRDQNTLYELNRRLAAYRKGLHDRLVNRVLAMGNTINLEKLSYRAWQRNFGKSVGFRAPGMFVSILRRKAESAGGAVNEFPVRNRLSQICHNCGESKKKSLSQRWHSCSCGIHAQRDLYSAFLAMNIVGNDLDISQAQFAWTGAEPLLCHAISRCDQTVIGKVRFASFGLNRSQNGSHGKERSTQDEAGNAVTYLSVGESLGESCGIALRTPCL